MDAFNNNVMQNKDQNNSLINLIYSTHPFLQTLNYITLFTVFPKSKLNNNWISNILKDMNTSEKENSEGMGVKNNRAMLYHTY